MPIWKFRPQATPQQHRSHSTLKRWHLPECKRWLHLWLAPLYATTFTQQSNLRQVNYLAQPEKAELLEPPRPIRKMKICAIYTVHMERLPVNWLCVGSVGKIQKLRGGPEGSLMTRIARMIRRRIIQRDRNWSKYSEVSRTSQRNCRKSTR